MRAASLPALLSAVVLLVAGVRPHRLVELVGSPPAGGAGMIGVGSQCDTCGKQVVDPTQDSFLMHGHPRVPAGWFVLYGPAPAEPAAAADRKDYCSSVCARGKRGEPELIDLVTDLHEAVYGNSWARPETPQAVWAMLIRQVAEVFDERRRS
jgi:hypothetical protein